MQAIAIGLLIINIIAAAVTVADKSRARRGARRVPERTLWTIAVCGGAVGMYVTMRLVRHKTKHRRFMWGLPLLIALQAAGVCAVWCDTKFPM